SPKVLGFASVAEIVGVACVAISVRIGLRKRLR
ncbi:transmembrane protein, partial [Arabidopsis thaliana]